MTDIEIASQLAAKRGYIVIGHQGPPLRVGAIISVFNTGIDVTRYPLMVIAETDYADMCEQSRMWPEEDTSVRTFPSRSPTYYRAVAAD